MKVIRGSAELQLGPTSSPTAELGLGVPSSRDAFMDWYSRGFLPHLDAQHGLHVVTVRLADSVPQQTLRQLELDLHREPVATRDRKRRTRIERGLDAGMGC